MVVIIWEEETRRNDLDKEGLKSVNGRSGWVRRKSVVELEVRGRSRVRSS